MLSMLAWSRFDALGRFSIVVGVDGATVMSFPRLQYTG